jgi:nitroimidazol reductase NimA-like FMN-containing flavoprotein (pyridoxamine 5'-phosphate oxidase superfamily)
MDEHLTQAKAIIAQTKYATLATVSNDGKPWNTPVFFAYDDAYTIYWGSYKATQHSQNIEANGRVFIVIYDSTAEPGKGKAVYMQARANELADVQEITRAISLLNDRYGKVYLTPEDVHGEQPHPIYKATSEQAWVTHATSRVQIGL